MKTGVPLALEGFAARCLIAQPGERGAARAGTDARFARVMGEKTLPDPAPARPAPSDEGTSPSPDAYATGIEVGSGPLGREEPGRYQLRRELARGGQGVVFVAWDTHLGREVAFKQLLRSPAPGFRGGLSQPEARFVREARITAQLDHPGIAPLHEVGRRADGSLYATQRLVPGPTLTEALAACTALPQRLALLGPLAFVCETVAFAHRRGVIHRDLKPDNVLVQENGQAVVLDWGLGRTGEDVELAQGSPVASLVDADQRTLDGAVLGTPAYMSPEQAAGDTLAVGPASDVWALGVMLYEVLVGRRPFEGTSSADVLHAVRSQPLVPVRERCPQAPPALAELARRALERDPAARPRDAGAFAALLSAARRPRPPPRRGWAAALAGTALLGALGAGVAWRAGPVERPPPASGVEPSVLTWADLPMSASSSEVARTLFREGLNHYAAGQRHEALAALDQAFKADPQMASAALQRAWVGAQGAEALGTAEREAYRAAVLHRAELAPRDQAFLDAIGPNFLDPPRWQQTERRLQEFVKQRPGDVQAVDTLGMVQTKLGMDIAPATFEREAALSPGDVGAHSVWTQMTPGADAKRAILADCLARRPASTDCRMEAFNVATRECDGDELDRLARDLTAVAPRLASGWYARALAAAVQGAPDETIADLQARGRALLAPEVRARRELDDATELALHRGDLAAVLRLLLELEKTPPTDGWDFESWSDLSSKRVHVLRESGNLAEAARAATTFLSRLPSLGLVEQWETSNDVPFILGVASQGGLLDAATLRSRREAWIAAARSRQGGTGWSTNGASIVTQAFFTRDVPTPAQAEEALATMQRLGVSLPEGPGGGDHPAFMGTAATKQQWFAIGALLLGAGKPAAAVPWLRGAAKTCSLTPWIRAKATLARALDASHDTAGACAAYAEVLAAWPNPRPRSVTVEQARARSRALDCPGGR
jgi:tetratricopeptide (TPR) repeat protein